MRAPPSPAPSSGLHSQVWQPSTAPWHGSFSGPFPPERTEKKPQERHRLNVGRQPSPIPTNVEGRPPPGGSLSPSPATNFLSAPQGGLHLTQPHEPPAHTQPNFAVCPSCPTTRKKTAFKERERVRDGDRVGAGQLRAPRLSGPNCRSRSPAYICW